MSKTTLLERGWKPYLASLLSETQSQVFISSPYISVAGAEFIALHLSEKCRSEGQFCFLTNLSPQNIAQGATDPKAIQMMESVVSHFKLWHLPSLHANVYVSDARKAVITSGNLTAGGLFNNYEYGVGIEDESVVEIILRDVTAYASLGVSIDAEKLDSYVHIAEEVKAQFQKSRDSIKKEVGKTFHALLQKAENELLRARVSEGSVHRIFANTILYLLQKNGPLTTQQLHPLIAQIHPDLCNDTFDLIIDGRNFGRKWKHSVRSSQVSLKRSGEIELVDGLWRIPMS